LSALVINAAGKLTALGGSAQSDGVAAAQRDAAQAHVDLADYRAEVSARIAEVCGAQAACITSGAAAGIAISIAALVTRGDPGRVRLLPQTEGTHPVLLQAGHSVNFGAPVEQMIRLGGGRPRLVGDANQARGRELASALGEGDSTAMLYVQSHHAVQTNQISLDDCVSHCKQHGVPLIVDAAAEDDLGRYIDAGADLVIYSGGKAFAGPTSGFIVGRADLIEHCEQQGVGIARTMKVGKEAIAGLARALDEYTADSEEDRLATYAARNELLLAATSGLSALRIGEVPDEAGRPFSRIAVHAQDVHALVSFLVAGDPSIRTRNHHLDAGYLLIDPRELRDEHVDLIIERLSEYR